MAVRRRSVTTLATLRRHAEATGTRLTVSFWCTQTTEPAQCIVELMDIVALKPIRALACVHPLE